MQEQNIKKYKLNYRKITLIMYLMVVLVMVILLIGNILLRDKKEDFYGLGSYIDVTDSIVDNQGEVVDFSEIRGIDDTLSVFYTIPDNLNSDQGLIFRSKNAFVSVYIDNKQVYSTDITNAPFYNHSPGTRWNIVNINEEDAGKEVEIVINMAYEDGRVKIDSAYLGSKDSIIINIIGSKSVGLLISIFMLFVGVLYLIANIVVNWNVKKRDYSILYLGLFAICCSIWCMLETNIFQLFSNNLRQIQVIDNMMLVAGGIPLFLYMDSNYNTFKNKFVKFLCGVNLVYIILATIFQLCNLWDYHQTLNGAIITYGFASIILVISIVKQAIRYRKNINGIDISIIFQQIGIVILAISVFIEFVRYLSKDVLDRAFVIRVGLLLCIICLGAGNIYRMIQLMKQGARAELISKLAYEDGLTELGNRTAYIEKINNITEKSDDDKLGMVVLDINNLKFTNDKWGHSSGDDLIKVCGKIIANSFGKVGSVYRIGGDEFVVLISDEDPRDKYNKTIDIFNELIIEYNQIEEYPFKISMAQGVAYCDIINAESISNLEKEADSKMYENKKEIKANAKEENYA